MLFWTHITNVFIKFSKEFHMVSWQLNLHTILTTIDSVQICVWIRVLCCLVFSILQAERRPHNPANGWLVGLPVCSDSTRNTFVEALRGKKVFFERAKNKNIYCRKCFIYTIFGMAYDQGASGRAFDWRKCPLPLPLGSTTVLFGWFELL